MKHIETSTKSNINVDIAFMTFAEMIYKLKNLNEVSSEIKTFSKTPI